MTPNEAARLLGLTHPRDWPVAVVQDAFRFAVKADHPDQGGDGSKITKLKEARDLLLDHANGVKPACPVCHGDGEVLGRGFKAIPCPRGCKAGEHGQLQTKRAERGKRSFRP